MHPSLILLRGDSVNCRVLKCPCSKASTGVLCTRHPLAPKRARFGWWPNTSPSHTDTTRKSGTDKAQLRAMCMGGACIWPYEMGCLYEMGGSGTFIQQVVQGRMCPHAVTGLTPEQLQKVKLSTAIVSNPKENRQVKAETASQKTAKVRLPHSRSFGHP